ncbi:MAG: hypothetical protein U0793_14175 [Gemmataceae bacterium]
MSALAIPGIVLLVWLVTLIMSPGPQRPKEEIIGDPRAADIRLPDAPGPVAAAPARAEPAPEHKPALAEMVRAEAAKAAAESKKATPTRREAAPPAVCAAPGGPLPETETFGTAISFTRNPSRALKLAAEQDKLAFVLHVSGNFEDTGFT